VKKERNPLLVEDTRWKVKGGPMRPSTSEPKICPKCKGVGRNDRGIECFYCFGDGDIYE